MTKSATPTICDTVVDCVSTARAPTVLDLDSVAERIWSESQNTPSVFRWDDLAPSAPGRISALRAAHAALCGDDGIDPQR